MLNTQLNEGAEFPSIFRVPRKAKRQLSEEVDTHISP